MDEERWQALVRKLEPRARANPAGYRRKVVLLAVLGYAYIAVLLLALLAVAVVVVTVAIHHAVLLLKLLIPLGALAWVIVRSLWVRFEPPEGVAIHRQDAPELFRMIEEVRAKIAGPKVHEVLVDDEANAGVVQVPRLGGLAGSRNYLVLGLPYMQALSPEQFRAVVAHELGHLSRAHGRFGAFVYRVRGTWFQLLQGLLERKSLLTGIVSRFFRWYVPYFDAYTLPIQRAHEFEADDAAADAAGKEAAASSLVAGMLSARWLHEVYWPRLYERAADEPTPPRTAFAPLAQELPAAKNGNAERWFREQLEVETEAWDSHPSLRERIAHLGLDPQEVLRAAAAPVERSAAAAFLGGSEHAVVAAVEKAWANEIAPSWREQHLDAQRAKQELQRLDARAAEGELSPEDALTRAHLTATFRGDDALERYRELLDTDNDAPARFGIGKLLLARGDEEGLRWLDEAMDRDPDAVLLATELAFDWLRERGRDEEAERYRKRAEQQVEVLEAAEEERSTVSVDDELQPPALPADLVEQIRKKVAWHDEVAEAYLVRKKTEHLDDEHPFHVVALVPKSAFRTAWREADDDVEPLEDRVARDLPLDDVMVAKIGRKSPLAERFAEIDGAKLFSRD